MVGHPVKLSNNHPIAAFTFSGVTASSSGILPICNRLSSQRRVTVLATINDGMPFELDYVAAGLSDPAREETCARECDIFVRRGGDIQFPEACRPRTPTDSDWQVN
jgi:hypothetical protein